MLGGGGDRDAWRRASRRDRAGQVGRPGAQLLLRRGPPVRPRALDPGGQRGRRGRRGGAPASAVRPDRGRHGAPRRRRAAPGGTRRRALAVARRHARLLRTRLGHLGAAGDDQGARRRGRSSLGHAFVDGVLPYVYPEHLEPAAIDDVRRTKVRLEEYIRQRGKELTEVKRGRGGIRDVEFAVQLLQIVHGRRNPALRSPNTLSALQALAEEGYVADPDASALGRGVSVPAPSGTPAADRPRPADPRPAGRPACTDDDRAIARPRRRRGPAGRVRPHDRIGPVDPRAAVLPTAAGGLRRSGAAAARRRSGRDAGAAGGPGLRAARPQLRGARSLDRPGDQARQGARARVAGDDAGDRAGRRPGCRARPARAGRGGGGAAPRPGRRARRPIPARRDGSPTSSARVGSRPTRSSPIPSGYGRWPTGSCMPTTRRPTSCAWSRDTPHGSCRRRETGAAIAAVAERVAAGGGRRGRRRPCRSR